MKAKIRQTPVGEGEGVNHTDGTDQSSLLAVEGLSGYSRGAPLTVAGSRSGNSPIRARSPRWLDQVVDLPSSNDADLGVREDEQAPQRRHLEALLSVNGSAARASKWSPSPESVQTAFGFWWGSSPTNAQKVEFVRDRLQRYPPLAQYVLDTKYPTSKCRREGFCWLLDGMVGNKGTKGGYVQVSYWGANKFALLHHVVLWAGGYDLSEGLDASHRCHKPSCTVVGHVVPESTFDNNGRKGCQVVQRCPCGRGWQLLCRHRPTCIMSAQPPGANYQDWDSFLSSGICHINNGLLPPIRVS